MALIDDPDHLRLLAADMRARAEKALFPETKAGLLRYAGDYDELVTRAEQRIAWWQARESAVAVEAPPVQPSDDRVSEGEPEGQATPGTFDISSALRG